MSKNIKPEEVGLEPFLSVKSAFWISLTAFAIVFAINSMAFWPLMALRITAAVMVPLAIFLLLFAIINEENRKVLGNKYVTWFGRYLRQPVCKPYAFMFWFTHLSNAAMCMVMMGYFTGLLGIDFMSFGVFVLMPFSSILSLFVAAVVVASQEGIRKEEHI